MITLKDIGSVPRKSSAWEPGHAEIIRFWCDDGYCYGFSSFALAFGAYAAEQERLYLQYAPGTIVICGPKAGEFWDDFCARLTSSVKADGVDVLSVSFVQRQGEEE
jgi:hypothetical protein